MELYYSFSILIVLASFFAYLNLRFLKLPPAIGIRIGHWTRIDRIYTEVDPAARAAYEERISR